MNQHTCDNDIIYIPDELEFVHRLTGECKMADKLYICK